jgi:hypothetical protein
LLLIVVCLLVPIILIISCRAGPQGKFLLCRRSHHRWYWILGICVLDLGESYIFRFEVKWVDPPVLCLKLGVVVEADSLE